MRTRLGIVLVAVALAAVALAVHRGGPCPCCGGVPLPTSESPAETQRAEAQKVCPVTGEPLGSMGVPVEVDLGHGRSAFVCCKGCVAKARENPEETLKKVDRLKSQTEKK